jgi:tRNA nucleotidyltransferase (CCA-adding enzyme)
VGLDISGTDLLAAGVPEGPAVGEALEAALAAKLDGEAAGREEQLAVALRAAGRQ